MPSYGQRPGMDRKSGDHSPCRFKPAATVPLAKSVACRCSAVGSISARSRWRNRAGFPAGRARRKRQRPAVDCKFIPAPRCDRRTAALRGGGREQGGRNGWPIEGVRKACSVGRGDSFMSSKSHSAERTDVHTRITAEIVAAIEAGAGDWRMPWHHDGTAVTRPENISSGKRYRGVNVLALWIATQAHGYADGTGAPTANGWPPERRCVEANVEPQSCFGSRLPRVPMTFHTMMAMAAGLASSRGRSPYSMPRK